MVSPELHAAWVECGRCCTSNTGRALSKGPRLASSSPPRHGGGGWPGDATAEGDLTASNPARRMLTKAKTPTDGIGETGNGSVRASGRTRILIMATKHAEKPPGVPLDHFIAAVDAIADLRDTGKAVVFLRGNGAVRIVGLSLSEAEFAQQLSERLEGVVPSSSEVQKTLAEIERFLSVILATENGTEAAAKRLLYSLLKEFDEKSEIDPGNPATIISSKR